MKNWPKVNNPDDIKVILQPLAMLIPNQHGIYQPSRLRPKKEITYREFLAKFAGRPRRIQVYLDSTIVDSDRLLSGSNMMTAYGFGLDCWYLVDEISGKERGSL